jgi:hypothetical protein
LSDELSFDFGSDVDMETETRELAIQVPGLYTGPPPKPPLCSIPTIPSAPVLAQGIINSADKLFFISRKNGFGIREWHLVCVAFSVSTSSCPSCLEDGKYIVNFYSSHPADFCLNTINQQFWLRYHTQEDLMGPCLSCDTHLIRPSDTFEFTPRVTIFFLFISTSTSLIQTLTFMVRSILLRSAAAKVATVLVPMTG